MTVCNIYLYISIKYKIGNILVAPLHPEKKPPCSGRTERTRHDKYERSYAGAAGSPKCTHSKPRQRGRARARPICIRKRKSRAKRPRSLLGGALCDADFACQAEWEILLKMNYFIVSVRRSAETSNAGGLHTRWHRLVRLQQYSRRPGGTGRDITLDTHTQTLCGTLARVHRRRRLGVLAYVLCVFEIYENLRKHICISTHYTHTHAYTYTHITPSLFRHFSGCLAYPRTVCAAQEMRLKCRNHLHNPLEQKHTHTQFRVQKTTHTCNTRTHTTIHVNNGWEQ